MAGLADQMREIAHKAQKEIDADSSVDAHRFVKEVIVPKMRSVATYGETSIIIPKDLPHQNRVGKVVESPSVGTYIEYDFDNNGNYTFIKFHHIEKELKAEGFAVYWNAENTPYLSISWA